MNQLALFATEPKPAPRRESYIPRCVARMWRRARSTEVEQDIMALFHAKPNDWLDWHDFSMVIKKHDINSCFGDILHAMVRRGLVREKPIYLGRGIGAGRPGLPNYAGFKTVYMFAGEFAA